MPKEVSIVTGANSGIGRYSGSWTMMMMMTRTSAIGVLFLTNKNKMTTTIMVS